MKKNLIALAIFGAFSGAALAQSNVTLYGIIDVGYREDDPETGSKTDGIQAGNQSGNRFGIRGSEALSPNLNAVFTIEGGFSLETGTMSQSSAACAGVPIPAAQPQNSTPCGGTTQTRIFGRQAWGGVAGNWGTLVAGRTASFSSGTAALTCSASRPFRTGFACMGILLVGGVLAHVAHGQHSAVRVPDLGRL
jgi:predicted porin